MRSCITEFLDHRMEEIAQSLRGSNAAYSLAVEKSQFLFESIEPIISNKRIPSVDKRQQAGWGEKQRRPAFSSSACVSKPSDCGLACRCFSAPLRSFWSLPEAKGVTGKADDEALLSVRRGE